MAAAAIRRQRHLAIVENPRPFPRVAPTGLHLGVHAGHHQPRAQQTLHVEGVVEFRLPDLLHELEEALGAALALKDIDLVHRLAGAHDRRKNIAHNP